MKIPNATIEEAVVVVQEILGGSGMLIKTEVQDEGEFVLFAIEIPPEKEEAKNIKLLLPYKEQLLQQLSALVPPKEDGDYSWMVVFAIRSKVIDSVMDDVPLE